MKLIGDIKKFSFGEMTSNTDGKTSATSTSGVYIVFIGGLCFLMGVIDKMFLDKTIDIINQSVMFTTIGAALLGVKNITASKASKTDTTDTTYISGTCTVCGKEPCICPTK